MRIQHEAASIRGRRENNEDAFLELPERGIFAVADGVGGHAGGEVASAAALASLRAYSELLDESGFGLTGADDAAFEVARERLAIAIHIADREVRRRAVADLERMGTTIVCLAIGGDRALTAHVGDSRAYRLRERDIVTLTRDHSLWNEMRAAGLAGLSDRNSFRLRNVITQALGHGTDAKPDIGTETVLPGDRFLLCSDGLSDVLDDLTIGWLLTSQRNVARQLVDAAYEAGSTDNITALVVTACED